jgi:hypothetical protein
MISFSVESEFDGSEWEPEPYELPLVDPGDPYRVPTTTLDESPELEKSWVVVIDLV